MSGVIQNIQKTNYNSKKAISKAALDAALFLSNVTQLKSILDNDVELGVKAKLGIGAICVSLLLQFSVGVLLIMILDVEGALIELKKLGTRDGLSEEAAVVAEVTNMEPAPSASSALLDDDRISKLTRRGRRTNTATMVFVFGILCLNLIINGLELSNPNTMDELIKKYNLTLSQ